MDNEIQRWNYTSDVLPLEKHIEQLKAENAKLRAALMPFTHPDLTKSLEGQHRDNEPIYVRNEAVLTLSDFKRAADSLKGTKL